MLCASALARADSFLVGDIRIGADGESGSYELTATLPAGIADDGALGWPADCVQTEFRRVVLGNAEHLVYRVSCDRPLGRGDAVDTRWELDAARLQSGLTPGTGIRTLLPERGVIQLRIESNEVGDRGWLEIAPEMLRQGLLHIWLGWDHLAFVLCICMLARGLPLIGLITAFTLGHSLSLGLAFFGLVRVPVPPTEAVIALSIVLLARAALVAGAGGPGRQSMARETVIITGFGLVHGLGFATALGELGISGGERWPALLFFNLGVELGQLAFVVAVVGVSAALRRISFDATARRLALHAAGIVGGFWLVERVAGF